MKETKPSIPLTSRLALIILVAALVLLFFNKMAFSNLILARGDTFLYFYPYWDAAADALRNGRVPLWNPAIFMGAPLLANSQVGFFYPLNWPVWWLLPTPYAVSASIVLHLMIAGWGAYLAGRRALSLSRAAAMLTVVLFALGGYMTAQVEHINQLQGLAWLPWFLVALSGKRLAASDWRRVLRQATAVALLFSLQLLAGHTQTAFITGVGVVVYWVATGHSPLASGRSHFTFYVLRFLPLLIAVLLAGLLTAVQLLPTLELTQYSSRQGGLAVNEVLSFSLHPLLLGRSLLPSYGQSLFTEYVAFLPLTALLLAAVGGWQWRKRPMVRAVVLVTAVAFLLALGRFTPIYWLLARLPGFDLFRVPARWLVWYALGMALLAGQGWDVVRDYWCASATEWRVGLARPLRWGAALIVGLMAGSWLAVPLARFIPLGPEAPAAYPAWPTIAGWLVEITTLLLLWRFRTKQSQLHPFTPSPLHLITLSFLFFASRRLPYNQLTTPEAYFDLRPPDARLQIDAAEPPGRLLSLSNIFFDPGDQAEIDAIYRDQLPADARYDYTVAIKQKEIIAPNLPMIYGLASVDGFDGGILPLNSYSQLLQTILPNQQSTVDGRLREYLTAVPPPHVLDLFNTRYLITDKTGDTWQNVAPGLDAFFDLQHPLDLAAGEQAAVGYVPDFPADGLAIVGSGTAGTVQIKAGAVEWQLTPQPGGANGWLVDLPAAGPVTEINLSAAAGGWRIDGLTLINTADLTFQPLVLGQYRLIHSGDVKIYENLDRLERAFWLTDWQWADDPATAVSLMQAADFNPRETAVLLGQGAPPPALQAAESAAIQITEYVPERVVVAVDAPQAGLLVLSDAHYPGWEAQLDGQPSPIYQADVLFRAIMLPAGQHEVIFEFKPQSYGYGRILSLFGIICWLALNIVIRKPFSVVRRFLQQ